MFNRKCKMSRACFVEAIAEVFEPTGAQAVRSTAVARRELQRAMCVWGSASSPLRSAKHHACTGLRTGRVAHRRETRKPLLEAVGEKASTSCACLSVRAPTACSALMPAHPTVSVSLCLGVSFSAGSLGDRMGTSVPAVSALRVRCAGSAASRWSSSPRSPAPPAPSPSPCMRTRCTA